MLKHFLLTCLACILLFSKVSAQGTDAVDKVATLLENADVFVKYRTFRSDFEKTNKELGAQLKYYEDYDMLNVAYNDVQSEYNEFLEIVRKDLSDWAEIKSMGRSPNKYANKYLTEYNTVIEAYNKRYKPVYNKVLANSNISMGKFIPAGVVVMGIQVFNAVVDIIKNRKEEKAENLGLVIGTINTYFYQKLRMKSWAELDIPVPTATRPAVPTDTKPSPGPITGNRPTSPGQNANPRMGATPTVTQVSSPLFSNMSGFVEFHYLDANDQDLKMNFMSNMGKNIVIETRKPQNGGIITTNQTNRVDFYNSEDSFAEGEQFYIKVNNTAGLYVITQNSDGSIATLYPYNTGKNIIIEGRDRNSVTTLPEADKSMTPPKQRYYTFDGASTKESFCILLTRSDLDLTEVKNALEAIPDLPLHDRLAKVFGDKLVQPSEAGVTHTENRLSFDASASKGTVLPVVFYINRK